MLVCKIIVARPNFMKMDPVIKEMDRRVLNHILVRNLESVNHCPVFVSVTYGQGSFCACGFWWNSRGDQYSRKSVPYLEKQ